MSTLEQYIRQRLESRPILLMSHLVLGHPSLAENGAVIDRMVAAGVDVMELQIPFSEPTADGPVIARANQQALDTGLTVDQCLAFIGDTVKRHPIPFLIMTYYNILFVRGVERFIREAAALGVKGLIVPDLPVQEAGEAMALCRELGLSWIQLMAPTCTDERLAEIGSAADGFVYCVARRGVTGKDTRFGDEVAHFIQRCRAATGKPLAVGFGVKRPEDVAYLAPQAELAVVGTASITLHEREGAAAVGRFFRELRPLP